MSVSREVAHRMCMSSLVDVSAVDLCDLQRLVSGPLPVIHRKSLTKSPESPKLVSEKGFDQHGINPRKQLNVLLCWMFSKESLFSGCYLESTSLVWMFSFVVSWCPSKVTGNPARSSAPLNAQAAEGGSPRDLGVASRRMYRVG